MAEEQFKVKVRPRRSSSRQIESTNNLEAAKGKEGGKKPGLNGTKLGMFETI
jgi:hypothetical protein